MHRLLQQNLVGRRSVASHDRFLREAEEGRLLQVNQHPLTRNAACKSVRHRTTKHFMRNWPYYAYLCLIMSGIAIFYALDLIFPPSLDTRVTRVNECMGYAGFAGYLFFCLSATTTIGFGTLYPCNLVSRIFGIFYCVLGIPLTLLILARVGEVVCSVVHNIHEKMPPRTTAPDTMPKRKRGSKRHKNVPKILVQDLDNDCEEETEEKGNADHHDIPISIGIALIVIFVLLCSFYYVVAERYGLSESIYYGFYTLVAGDLQIRNVQYGIVIFALVLLGFGMVATTYDIIQQNIENLTRKVEKALQRHQEAILKGEMDAKQGPEEVLHDIMRRYSTPFLRMTMRESQRRALQETSARVVDKARAAVGEGNTKGTQLDGREHHFHTSRGVWNVPQKESAKTQVRPLLKDAGHQMSSDSRDSAVMAYPTYVDAKNDVWSPVSRKDSDSQAGIEQVHAKVATENLMLCRDIEIGTEDRCTHTDTATSTALDSDWLVDTGCQTAVKLWDDEKDAMRATELRENTPTPDSGISANAVMEHLTSVPDLVASHTQTSTAHKSLTDCGIQSGSTESRDAQVQFESTTLFQEASSQVTLEQTDNAAQVEMKESVDTVTQYEPGYFTQSREAQCEAPVSESMWTQIESIPTIDNSAQSEVVTVREVTAQCEPPAQTTNQGSNTTRQAAKENAIQTENPGLQNTSTSTKDFLSVTNRRISATPDYCDGCTDTIDFMDYIKKTHNHLSQPKQEKKPQWRL